MIPGLHGTGVLLVTSGKHIATESPISYGSSQWTFCIAYPAMLSFQR